MPSKCERKIWYFWAMPMDYPYCEVKLKISHPGYQEKELSKPIPCGAKLNIDFGKIILEKR